MFTEITWQDYLAASDRCALVQEAIRRYKASAEFAHALDANCYFRGENPRVARKTILRARKVESLEPSGRRRVRPATEDVVGHRIASSFLFRFVTQQNEFLLSEGVSLPAKTKRRLGRTLIASWSAWANAPCCTAAPGASGTPIIWRSSRRRRTLGAASSPCWTK